MDKWTKNKTDKRGDTPLGGLSLLSLRNTYKSKIANICWGF